MMETHHISETSLMMLIQHVSDVLDDGDTVGL
jgi:hypothetical protein